MKLGRPDRRVHRAKPGRPDRRVSGETRVADDGSLTVRRLSLQGGGAGDRVIVNVVHFRHSLANISLARSIAPRANGIPAYSVM